MAAGNGKKKSAIPESMRAAIIAARAALEAGGHPSSTDDIRVAVRYGVSRSNENVCEPYTVMKNDRGLIEHRGWIQIIGEVMRRTMTTGGERTLVSVSTSSGGREYKQLAFVYLEDAMGVLQAYESSERADRLQARGWRLIVSRLTEMPDGASVADVFKSEDSWDSFWTGIRATDLAA